MTDRNCCDGLCEQGRSCPRRLEDSPRPRPDYSVEIAAVMAFVVILGTWGLIWLWELWI
jgi:hypothetical protein